MKPYKPFSWFFYIQFYGKNYYKWPGIKKNLPWLTRHKRKRKKKSNRKINKKLTKNETEWILEYKKKEERRMKREWKRIREKKTMMQYTIILMMKLLNIKFYCWKPLWWLGDYLSQWFETMSFNISWEKREWNYKKEEEIFGIFCVHKAWKDHSNIYEINNYDEEDRFQTLSYPICNEYKNMERKGRMLRISCVSERNHEVLQK